MYLSYIYLIFSWFERLGQKDKTIFVGFLVQMENLVFAFEINWPLIDLIYLTFLGSHLIFYFFYLFKHSGPLCSTMVAWRRRPSGGTANWASEELTESVRPAAKKTPGERQRRPRRDTQQPLHYTEGSFLAPVTSLPRWRNLVKQD